MSWLAGLQTAVDRANIAKWRLMVGSIQRRVSMLEKLTNAELRKLSLSKKYDVLSGQTLDELVVEAGALVQVAATRAIGLTHYPVQLLGGIAMHYGTIAVMQTGEGKTLTATLPLYLAALTGRGAHLATANDYLAQRDARLMQPVYELLGMSVGVVQSQSNRSQRKKAYAADITYTTAKEIGFDFLRDRLYLRESQSGMGNMIEQLMGLNRVQNDQPPVQRDPNFVLVDEADSILIDEARTPLIVSSIPDQSVFTQKELYHWAAKQAENFKCDEHYQIDDKPPNNKRLKLTEAGRKLVRQAPKNELLRVVPILDIYERIEQAIHVNRNFFKDRHYVVRDGEVVIVDEFTGRLAEGRKWRSGLHQAIEAREGLDISVDSGEAARITIQDLILRYPRIAGMTGTAANSSFELRKIYRVKVVEIPTHRPPKRIQWPDLIFATERQKWQAIADEIHDLHTTGRPVLIGTRSIDKSERLSQLLDQMSIEHSVLNARHLSSEAQIVAAAGQVSRVTVATNMAGRGTDIKISSAAADLGGLHVICSEMHESARIDRQLIGRCGRQGDPGSYRIYMSLDDDLLEQSLGINKSKALREKYAGCDPCQLARFSTLFKVAQERLERRYFHARKMLLYQEKQNRQLQTEMGQDPYLDTAGA